MALNNEEILSLLEQLDKESKALKKEIIKICWFMRGGITYDQAMELSYEERNMIADLINDNLETTKKTGMPFF